MPNRDLGGEIIYCAIVRHRHLPADPTFTWTQLQSEDQESYKVAADALFHQLSEEVGSDIAQIVDGEFTRVMSARDFEDIKKSLSKWCSRYKPTFAELVGEAFSTLTRQEDKHLEKFKSFQEDTLTYLRAIALVADSVGNAGTHKEKDARMRGLISQIETAIQRIRNGREELFTKYWWDKPDLFRSDYPVIRYLEKIRQLESEIEGLKGGNQSSHEMF